MALSLVDTSRLVVRPDLAVNLPMSELARRLPVQRTQDPLGLGAPRPAAPPDPDAGRAPESSARDLLSAGDRAALEAEVREHGHLAPAAVRSLIAENCTREQLEHGLDPEFLLLIDARINYKLFIAGDSIYTREELYSNFPFHEFGVQPEAVFVAQEVGVFTARSGEDYALRDAGDRRLDFSPAEDLVRAACGGAAPRAPTRIVQTKVFVGREAWEDFLLQMRFYRGAIRIAAAGGGASCGATQPLALTTVNPTVTPTVSPMVSSTVSSTVSSSEAPTCGGANRGAHPAGADSISTLAAEVAELRQLVETLTGSLRAIQLRLGGMVFI